MNFCGIKVESNFFLAPMAGITNLPFRLLCKKQGAGMVFTEQANATQIARMPKKALENFSLLKTCTEEKPVAVQLFGNSVKDFAKTAGLVEESFEMVNVNAGCPATRETKIGAGAALLKEPEKIVEIVKRLKEVCKKPVSVKIRLGWGTDDSARICKMIEKSGADAIIVHARLAGQGYSGKADWSAVRPLAKNSTIPIVYNGDIIDAKSAFGMLEKTGCDFGMIGRAAMQNPFIFKEIAEFEKGKEWKAGSKEKTWAFFEYYELCESFGTLDLADLKLKAMQLSKGIEGARKAREEIMKAGKVEEISKALERLNQS
ncbi:MAG: tRNA-dihydrouridine synthase [Candidatus Diapherotrites archaeon]|uniref:tRNA-dihydrouridine synthase n=1 Tax=Candidatus Iainarchaeum sp. TaxID=3101447 RepID=A0A8T4KUP9_9ARCH|nr:tRNA-dihydrouridine synthase [Candidatus Diapherotrites archaeon]